jgi:hypothetical protein
MPEARVGRLLTASLHQALTEELPQRLDFYEHWLGSEAVRGGPLALAPLTAVIGFLRTEGDGYGRVMSRAGRLAAEWTAANWSPLRRRTLLWLPAPLRARLGLRLTAGLVRSMSSATRTSSRIRKRQARLRVTDSIFCEVRERQPAPLCVFYAAAAAEVLRQLGLAAHAHVDRCRAVDRSSCVIVLDFSGAAARPDPAIAA